MVIFNKILNMNFTCSYCQEEIKIGSRAYYLSLKYTPCPKLLHVFCFDNIIDIDTVLHKLFGDFELIKVTPRKGIEILADVL